MGSCAAPSAKGDDKFITTDYLQQCPTELCGNLNLMLGGALEVINDWSYAVVDAPVLDDADDDIWVDLEIAKELEG
ncbi:tellurite resistance TerB C-terminal domain-containing protein [Klebsiella pneumoniae]|uniref:tellurite resistance TerB C-terminal domain-containing protein n=1 Tax=Klebsiella pneumoniae TaxID=573 RepID=UPI00182F8A4F|nr:hypothetical protein [Klebsiella pneumoniae]NOP35620.1 hypothetical protein [Klebsiella pneumoniae]